MNRKESKVCKARSVPASPVAESEISPLSLKVPSAMRAQLNALAAHERRSLNQQCVLLIQRGLDLAQGAMAARG